MKKKNLILLTCALFFAGVSAQNKLDTLQITLPQAVEIAISSSPTIKIANKELERIDYSKKSAWYALIPNLEGSAQYAKYALPAKTSMFGQVMDSPTDFNTNLGISVSLPLFAPALWHSIKMTTIDMQAAVEKANASKINLRNEVTKAYYNVLVAQDAYKVLKDGYELNKKNYEVAKKGYETGAIAAYDYISAEVQLNNMMPNIIQTENGIQQAKTYLKILMGLDVTTPIKVTNKLSDFEKDVVEIKNLIDLSLDKNPDLKQLDITRAQLQNTLKIQESQRFPTLAAFGQSGYSGTGNKATTINFGQMPIQVEKDSKWFGQGILVGLQMKIPLTGIFTNSPKEKQLKIQDEEIALQREQAKNSLQLQANTSLDKMNKTVKQVEAANKSIQLAEKAYSISSKMYENGTGTMVALQGASLAVTQARLSYYQAISDYLSAKADLEKILGEEIK